MSVTLNLDQKIQDYLQEKVLQIKADYAEIRAEQAENTTIIYKGKEPELISTPFSLGFFVRVLINGSWGVTTFTDIDQLDKKIAQAQVAAKLQGKGRVILAVVESAKVVIEPVISKDFRLVPLQQKVALVSRYNKVLLTAAPNIQTTNTYYLDASITKFFVNSEGSKIYQKRPYIRLNCTALARVDGIVEGYRKSVGHIGGFEIVEGLEDEMVKVAKQAQQLAGCPRVKSGKYSAILDPLMAGTFAHEAFGHFSEADHQYESPKLLKQMKLGKKLGSQQVNIVDDPNLEGGWGNFTYDDEGVQAKKIALLTSGVITGRLHSRETAGKLNEIPNGHARADGFSSRPIVRMSNTYFLPGQFSLKELIKDTQKGILVVNWMAGMTALEDFTFTALYGVMIENGKLTQQVRGVKLMGNVFDTLKNIDAVSNDFQHDQGTCGKLGQSIPVGSGGGYVRINNITLGGA